jgi:hypothetical protein
MKPDWFLLMQEWIKQGYGDRGVTLPFLVGALTLRNRSSQPSTENAKAILAEMIANPVEGYSTDIGWCSTLGAPVLAAVPSPSPATSKVGFPRPGDHELRVVFGEQLQRHWNLWDAQSLLNELIDDSRKPILQRRFSSRLNFPNLPSF